MLLLAYDVAPLEIVDDHVVLPDGAMIRIADGLPLGDSTTDADPVLKKTTGAASTCAQRYQMSAAARGPGWVILVSPYRVLRVTLPGCRAVAATEVPVALGAWGTRGDELIGADHEAVVRLRMSDLATLSIAEPEPGSPTWELTGPSAVLRSGDVRCTVSPIQCEVQPVLAQPAVDPPARIRLLPTQGPPWLQVLPKGVQVVSADGHTLGVPLPVYAEEGLVSPDGALVVLREGDDVSVWEVATGRKIGAMAPELEGEVVAVGAGGIGLRLGEVMTALYTLSGAPALTGSSPDGRRWTVEGAAPARWQGAMPAIGPLATDPVERTLNPPDPVFGYGAPSVTPAPAPTVLADWSPLPALGDLETPVTELLLPGARFQRDARGEAAIRGLTRHTDMIVHHGDAELFTRFPGAEAVLVAGGQVRLAGTLTAAVAALPRVGLDALDVPLPTVRPASEAFTLARPYFEGASVEAAPDGGAWVGFNTDTIHISSTLVPTVLDGALVGRSGAEAILRRGGTIGIPGRWSVAGLGATISGSRIIVKEDRSSVVADAATGLVVRRARDADQWSSRGWTLSLYTESPMTCMRTPDDRSLGCYPAEGAATWVGDTALMVGRDGVLHAWRGGKEVWRHTGLVADQVVAVDERTALVQAGGPLGPWLLLDTAGTALAAWDLGEEVSVAGGIAWGVGGTTLRRVEVKP